MLIDRTLSVTPVSLIDWYTTKIQKDPVKVEQVLSKTSPALLEAIGRRKTVDTFHFTAKRVKHYSNFLDINHIQVRAIRSFEDFMSKVPEIDKESYINTSHNYYNLLSSSNIDNISIIFQSSGHTGVPTLWARDREEENRDRQSAKLVFNLLFKTYKYRTLFVNCFALGSWVTGIELSRIADSHCTIINPGANEEDIISIIKNLKDAFDQIVLAAYPPFIKNLLQLCIKKGVNIKDINLRFMLGGEGIPEKLRDRFYELIGKKINYKEKIGYVYSGFGTSDLGMGIAQEVFESVHIRRLAWKNPKLAKALFNETTNIPMLFQYDPTKHLIYANKKRELIFTALGKGLLPLIKYNLKDTGGIISYELMKETLNSFGIDMDITLPLPFLYIFGRSDGAVNFYGSVIYPTIFQEILMGDSKIESKLTGNFKLDVEYGNKDNPYLSIEIQLKKKISVSKQLQDKILRMLKTQVIHRIVDLKAKKKYFDEHYTNGVFIKVKLYSFDDFPYKGLKFKYH